MLACKRLLVDSALYGTIARLHAVLRLDVLQLCIALLCLEFSPNTTAYWEDSSLHCILRTNELDGNRNQLLLSIRIRQLVSPTQQHALCTSRRSSNTPDVRRATRPTILYQPDATRSPTSPTRRALLPARRDALCYQSDAAHSATSPTSAPAPPVLRRPSPIAPTSSPLRSIFLLLFFAIFPLCAVLFNPN